MANNLSSGVTLYEELMDGKKVFVAESVELGISDFGETVDEALENLKKAITLFLEEILGSLINNIKKEIIDGKRE